MTRKQEVHGVDCPRCGDEGPHARESGDVAGTYVMAACPGCTTRWRVLG